MNTLFADEPLWFIRKSCAWSRRQGARRRGAAARETDEGSPHGETPGMARVNRYGLSRLRRGISTRKLTTYRHSSEKPNGAFRRYCQNRRRGADREATPGLCGRAISQASLQSRTTTQSAEPASRFPPLVLNISARVSGHLPEPLRPAPIAFMSGSKNPTPNPPQAHVHYKSCAYRQG